MAKKKTTVQTVICSKQKFKSEGEARSWVKSHGFKADKVDETEESYRYRQVDPSSMEEGSMRTMEMTDGVKAVVGHMKDGSMMAEMTYIVCKLDFARDKESNKAVLHALTAGTHYRVRSDGKFIPFHVTAEKIEQMVNNFHRMNLTYPERKLPVNIDHAHERVGDILDAYMEGSDMYLPVSVSDKVDMSAFREASIECMEVHPDEDGEDQGATLLGVALTNYAVVKGLKAPQILSQKVYDEVQLAPEKQTGGQFMNEFLQKVLIALGMKPEASEQDAIAKLAETVSSFSQIKGALDLASQRVTALEAENVRIKATSAVDALIGEKLLPIQKADFIELAQKDFAMFEKVVKGLPKLNLTQEIGHGSITDPQQPVSEPGAEIRRLAIERAAKANIAYDVAEGQIFAERPDLAHAYLGR